jgi:anti-sigma factor RsiW
LSEHLTRQQIEGYAGRTLAAPELLLLSDHLAACEACRRRVEQALSSDLTFIALRAEVFDAGAGAGAHPARAHPAVERVAAYVDGLLAGEELRVFTDHLTNCAECLLAADDLRAFRDRVAPELDREYRPAPARTEHESLRRRLSRFLPAGLPKAPALAFGSAAVLLLLTATLWLVWRGSEKRKTESELAQATSPPAVPAPAATAATPTPSPTATPGEASSAPPVAQLNDGGGRVTLDAEGQLSGADQLPPAYQRMVKESLAGRHLERSSLLAGLNRPESPLMAGDPQGNPFAVLGPVGKVLESDRPNFSWAPLAGATGYTVEVYDEAHNPVATSPQLAGNAWTSQPLKRGGVYTWQVKAVKDGQEFRSPRPPAAEARFRILDASGVSELRQARRSYGSSHLLLGLLYARAGLLDEAEREFGALQKANPDSAQARRLLSEIRRLRR